MWLALERFAQGGLYEARLKNFTGKNHPNHDILCKNMDQTEEIMPFMLKVLFDDMLPDFASGKYIFSGIYSFPLQN